MNNHFKVIAFVIGRILRMHRLKYMTVFLFNGLGNQLFQYAFYRSLKEKYPQSLIYLDTSKCEVHSGYTLDKIYKDVPVARKPVWLRLIGRLPARLQTLLNLNVAYLWEERYMDDGILSEKIIQSSAIINWIGCWALLYAKDDIDPLMNEISFRPSTDERNIRLISELATIGNTVFVHVRRGDYLLPENVCRFINLSETGYYERAIRYMQERLNSPLFIVFSNDVDWCKAHLPVPEGSRFVDWNQGDACYCDMQLMSMCRHSIISNSTFSGWAAWLNPNPDKIVVTPEKWFYEPRDFAGGCFSVTYSKDWIQL